MANYYILLLLFTCPALESGHIYRRQFAKSHSSSQSNELAHEMVWYPRNDIKVLPHPNQKFHDLQSDEDHNSGFISAEQEMNGNALRESYEKESKFRKGHQHTHCPKCKSNGNIAHLCEEELTRLRIEFVKHQILEKLRLKERPNVLAVELPQPILEDVTIQEEQREAPNKEYDDFYARTCKKFIFLEVETRECSKLHTQPSVCFSFKIDDSDADSFDVNTAVLWLYKSRQHKKRKATLLKQDTIVVSEVQQQLLSDYLPLAKTIAIQDVSVEDEWLKINIEWPIKRWFGNHELSHLIQVTCQSCNIKSMAQLIYTDKVYRPFIEVDMQNRRRLVRQKRSINCTTGITECCREQLYINFNEIGWGDWIVHPPGYDAYFCRGSCNSLASIAQSMSQHSSTVQKLNRVKRKNLELIPCCTAKEYATLDLFFRDSNNTLTKKTFPNMVVKSCGCR